MAFMSSSLLPLAVGLLLLLIDAAIEIALLSSMVGYLHRSGANQYSFFTSTGRDLINAMPKGLLGDEGHTSNGAAGTSVVLVCFGGASVLWRQMKRNRNWSSKGLSKLFLSWIILTILGFLLTLSALIYTYVLISQTSGQRIDFATAHSFQGDAYPLDKWTPQTWTRALLALALEHEVDRTYLNHWLRVMDGWRWNLIPMMLINLAVAVLAVREGVGQRRVRGDGGGLAKDNMEMRS